MKTNAFTLLLFVTGLFVSCDRDKDYEIVNIATPLYLMLETLRTSIEVTSPRPIAVSGKIYARENTVFVNDAEEGIHVIDNSDPVSPRKIAFIKIPGNMDMEVKGDFLYADSYVDLVVFDILDINNIKEADRLEDAFAYTAPFPEGDNIYVDNDAYQSGNGVVVGWEIKRGVRKIETPDPHIIRFNDFAAENAHAVTGAGGSLARFKIVEDYLYTVDWNSIHIFDIKNMKKPDKTGQMYAGILIETIFNRDELLFLGSGQGMYIYDISTPSTPEYVSEFRHAKACDPVVVDDTYAYITLRAGNPCGEIESSLWIVDITDISSPFPVKSYAMDNPYGVGIRGDMLFVCDGDSGLKVYNKADVENLELLHHFEDIKTYDVIPLPTRLLMIGDNVLHQYGYTDDGIEPVSRFLLQ
ncbi:LVIVD repeat-containing protein [Sinomicrobium sp. M5D2P9]